LGTAEGFATAAPTCAGVVQKCNAMPVFPEIRVETAPFCNLRQALQWLHDDIEPIDPAYEPALGRTDWVSNDNKRERSHLFASFVSKRIRLFGRFAEGSFVWEENDVAFAKYSELEEIPISRMIDAGFDGFQFQTSRIRHVTDFTYNGEPITGWEYVEVVMRTTELFAQYPPRSSKPPPDINLGWAVARATLPTNKLPDLELLFVDENAVEWIAKRTGSSEKDAGRALHIALCKGALVADGPNGDAIPTSLWRSYSSSAFLDEISTGEPDWGTHDGWLNCKNAILKTVDVDIWLDEAMRRKAEFDAFLADDASETAAARVPGHEPTANSETTCPAEVPLYLKFGLDVAAQLGGPSKIAKLTKKEVIHAIVQSWPEELFGPIKGRLNSDKAPAAIEYLAMFLRSPEAQLGGLRPSRARNNGHAGPEGSNGSSLSQTDHTEPEPAEGLRV